ncbi:hypothetical protein BGZ83_011264 [Gryganskiella cystojenkinii]|nr:hypothetical protein BGZ83_011264 [Gryganskiella cystojenkinii]
MTENITDSDHGNDTDRSVINSRDNKDDPGITLAVNRLAPEVILHFLSFLDYADRPSRLTPILTLCKQWARLALTLLYREPVLTMKTLDRFLDTLRLQGSLEVDHKPFWDPSHSSAALGQHPRPLGIDYHNLIKRPCRIIGPTAPSKLDLIKLWDLRQLLSTVPALLPPESLSPSPPLTPDSTASSPQASPWPSASPIISRPSTPFSGSSPSLSKPVVVRRPKRSPPRPGPVVMFLDVADVYSEPIHHVLLEVPEMKLLRFNYQWHVRLALHDALQSHLPYISEISLTKPPIRPYQFIELARLFDSTTRTTSTTEDDEKFSFGFKGGIRSLSLKNCQDIGRTVLSEFARSCGSTLQSLEIRQQAFVFQMEENHGLFPEEGPRDWLRPTKYDAVSDGSFGWQPCSKCESTIRSSSQGHRLHHLLTSGLADLTGDDSTAEESADGAAIESRMDLALLDFARSSPQLERIRLQSLTWLTDESLAGLGLMNKKAPLRTIEILDSYYGCFLTVQGLLRVCGPSLEELIVDRKSCWRTWTNPTPEILEKLLCTDCISGFEAMSTRETRTPSGDRILWGLLEKGTWPGVSAAAHGVNGLKKLVLVEHRVSANTLGAALKRWMTTLEVLTVDLYMCSTKDLQGALISPARETMLSSALETLTLKFTWMDGEEETVEPLVVELFGTHRRLEQVQVNKRIWRRAELFGLMQYRAPSYWMHFFTLFVTLVLLVIFAPSAAQANTEKVIFTVKSPSALQRQSETSGAGSASGQSSEDASTARSSSPSRRIETLAQTDPSLWKPLTSPHTILRSEKVRPSFYASDVTIASAVRRKQVEAKDETGKGKKSIISGELSAILQEEDLENREFQWYVLQDLDEGASFELRISYPATSPADFEMKVWTMVEAQEHVPKSIQLSEHFSKNTMFARIKATYTGVSYQSSPPAQQSDQEGSGSNSSGGPESRPVPYNLVLERLYFHIPYQALKLAVAIALAVVLGLGYGVPMVHRFLKQIDASDAISVKRSQ